MTVPSNFTFRQRTKFIDMYRDLFSDNIVYVIEKMTPLLSTYLKEALSVSLKKYKKGLNMDHYYNIGVYNGTGRSTSTVYNDIINSTDFEFYCSVEPGVVLFENVISTLNKTPFTSITGARFIASKYIYSLEDLPTLEITNELVAKDLDNDLINDFYFFPDKVYKRCQYSVLLSRKDYIKSSKLFKHTLGNCFVFTAASRASTSIYNTQFSSEYHLYQFRRYDDSW